MGTELANGSLESRETGKKVVFDPGLADDSNGENGMKSIRRSIFRLLVGAFLLAALPAGAAAPAMNQSSGARVLYKTVNVEGLDIFYREAGPADAPSVLLLHGFPTSSHMFRNLIPALADRYHVVAPDYPGFGNSSMPAVDEFEYTFDRLADIVEAFTEKLGLERYSLYMVDYGAPVGFRLATRHPERIRSLIIQNGNAYEEGLREFWKPLRAYWKDRSQENEKALRNLLTLEATRWQYTHGTRDPRAISPDNWNLDQRMLDRAGNQEIQLALFYDYGSNPPLYPSWQRYLRERQPPTLIVWGKNDQIFTVQGAHPFKRDLRDLEFHLFDTGHFALEEDGETIARLILSFLDRKVAAGATGP